MKLPYKVYSKTFADYGLCDICQCVNLPVTTFRKQIYCIDCFTTERRAQNKQLRIINSIHINDACRRRYHSRSPEKKEVYLVNQRKRRKAWINKMKNDDPEAYANLLEYSNNYREKMSPEQKAKYEQQKRESNRKIKVQRNKEALKNLKYKLDNDEQN